MNDAAAQPGTCSRWFWLATLAIAALWAVTYLRAFDAPFVFDDIHAIPENSNIRSLWPPSRVIQAPGGATLAGRPMVSYSVALNYQISGLEPWSYHLVNRALHLANALLLLWIVWHAVTTYAPLRERLGRFRGHGPWLAFTIAALWTVHTLTSETVVYVIQRTELIVTFFFLATLAAAMKGFDAAALMGGFDVSGATDKPNAACQRHPGSLCWFAFAAALSCLGMLSKEVMIAAPLVIWVFDRTLVSGSWLGALKRHKWLYVGLGASYALLAVILYYSPRGDTAGFNVGMKPLHYLYTQAWWITWYLRLSVLPTRLSLIYPFDLIDSFVKALPYGLFVVALLGVSVWLLIRRHWAGILGAVFFMVLAPSSSFVPIATEVAAERRMYIPLMTVVIAIVALVYAAARTLFPLPGREGGKRAFLPVAIVLALAAPAVLLLMIATVRRAELHRHEVALWEDAVAKYPTSAHGYNNLGYALVKAGKQDEAIAAYKRATELMPRYATPYNNIGNGYKRKGEYAVALRWYDRAIERDKRYADAYHNRGEALAALDRRSEAIASFEKAVELDARNGKYRNSYAIALHRAGNEPAAVEELKRTIHDLPELPEPYANLARIFARRGDLREAERLYRDALKRRPAYGEAMLGLAQVLTAQSPDAVSGEVRELWKGAVKELPGDAEAREGFALDLARQGKFEEAAEQFTALSKLRPGDAAAPGVAGLALVKAGKLSEAIEPLRAAAELDAKSASRRITLGKALAGAGRFDEAIAELKLASELEPANGDARLQWGATLSMAKRNEEALPVLREAVKLMPASVDARLRLAWALAVRVKVSESEVKEAVALAERAAGVVRADGARVSMAEAALPGGGAPPALAWDILGAAYARAGRFEEAMAATERAIVIWGSAPEREAAEMRLGGYREKRPWVARRGD